MVGTVSSILSSVDTLTNLYFITGHTGTVLGFARKGHDRQTDARVNRRSESLLSSLTASEGIRMVLRNDQVLLRRRVGNQDTHVKKSLSAVDTVLLDALSLT